MHLTRSLISRIFITYVERIIVLQSLFLHREILYMFSTYIYMNILIYLRIDYATVIKIRIRIIYFIMKIYSL